MSKGLPATTTAVHGPLGGNTLAQRVIEVQSMMSESVTAAAPHVPSPAKVTPTGDVKLAPADAKHTGSAAPATAPKSAPVDGWAKPPAGGLCQPNGVGTLKFLAFPWPEDPVARKVQFQTKLAAEKQKIKETWKGSAEGLKDALEKCTSVDSDMPIDLWYEFPANFALQHDSNIAFVFDGKFPETQGAKARAYYGIKGSSCVYICGSFLMVDKGAELITTSGTNRTSLRVEGLGGLNDLYALIIHRRSNTLWFSALRKDGIMLVLARCGAPKHCVPYLAFRGSRWPEGVSVTLVTIQR